ncbi:MAG TPA: hypothetical protein VNO70_11450, partial [Blastocatellia bacterium]|nr:hypothetical protein [Blastocatellia bacterium]
MKRGRLILAYLLCLAFAPAANLASLTIIAQSQGESSAQGPRWLERVGGRGEFEELARTHYQGRFYALPHLMFVIDRRAGGRVYYVNSNLYRFHKDFVN